MVFVLENKLVNNRAKMIVIDFILMLVLVALDQFVKYVFIPMKGKNPIVIIDKILELTYVENRGAAFGMLKGQRIFFIFLAIIFFLFMGFIIAKLPYEKKFLKLNIAFAFIFAGAIGNTVDRIIRGYVIDFIYFKVIDFPVFNVADVYITVATLFVVIFIIFCYKEEDFNFLKKEKENRKISKQDGRE